MATDEDERGDSFLTIWTLNKTKKEFVMNKKKSKTTRLLYQLNRKPMKYKEMQNFLFSMKENVKDKAKAPQGWWCTNLAYLINYDIIEKTKKGYITTDFGKSIIKTPYSTKTVPHLQKQLEWSRETIKYYKNKNQIKSAKIVDLEEQKICIQYAIKEIIGIIFPNDSLINRIVKEEKSHQMDQ